MGSLNNISVDQVKDFVKNNILLCVMLALDIVLFFSAISLGSSNDELEGEIDSLSIKKNQIESNITKLSTVNKDYQALQDFKTKFSKKCVNFGKKTSVYKFLNQISGFFEESASLNLSIVKSYNISKSQVLSLEQDLQPFKDDNIIVDYSLTYKATYSDVIKIINAINSLNYFIKLKQVDIKTTGDESILSANLVYSVLGKIRPKEDKDA